MAKLKWMKRSVWVWLCAAVLSTSDLHAYSAQEGDVVFHTSTSAQSEAIQLATRSPWSHMGIVLQHQDQLQVFEAVSPVRYTPLQEWLQRGKGGRYVALRPRTALSDAQVQTLRKAARRYVGKPYDLQFAWGNEAIYCSELVWKMYRDALEIQLAPLQRLRDFDLRNPVVKAKLTERYGRKLPLNEPVIAPVALFESKWLEKVAER